STVTLRSERKSYNRPLNNLDRGSQSQEQYGIVNPGASNIRLRQDLFCPVRQWNCLWGSPHSPARHQLRFGPRSLILLKATAFATPSEIQHDERWSVHGFSIASLAPTPPPSHG